MAKIMVRMPDGSAEPIGGGGIRYMDKKSFLNIAVPMDLAATSSTYSVQSPSNTTNKTRTYNVSMSYTFTARQSLITVTNISNIQDSNKVYIRNMAAGYLLSYIPNLSSTLYYRSTENRRFTSYGFVATGNNSSRVGTFMSASSTELVEGTGQYVSTTFEVPYIEPNNILVDFNKQNKMLAIIPYNISITGMITNYSWSTNYNVLNSLTNNITNSLTSEGNDGCRLNILNLDIIEYM